MIDVKYRRWRRTKRVSMSPGAADSRAYYFLYYVLTIGQTRKLLQRGIITSKWPVFLNEKSLPYSGAMETGLVLRWVATGKSQCCMFSFCS